MTPPIRNTQHALNALRLAREEDRKAWEAEIKGVRAQYQHGTYSGHFARSEKWANSAAERFAAVEAFLQRMI